MSKKTEDGGPAACTLGEIATVRYAPTGNTSIGAALLAAAINNHEYGISGRISA